MYIATIKELSVYISERNVHGIVCSSKCQFKIVVPFLVGFARIDNYCLAGVVPKHPFDLLKFGFNRRLFFSVNLYEGCGIFG